MIYMRNKFKQTGNAEKCIISLVRVLRKIRYFYIMAKYTVCKIIRRPPTLF
jgi:hypothetical protein